MSEEKTEVKKPKKSMKSIKAIAPDRKRRMDGNTPAGVKNVLTIPEHLLDRKNFEYRVVNMDEGRIEALEAKDWDIARIPGDVPVGDPVAGKAQSKGSATEINAGGGRKAVLMCKRKEWCDDDRAKKDELLRETEVQMQSDYKQKHDPIE